MIVKCKTSDGMFEEGEWGRLKRKGSLERGIIRQTVYKRARFIREGLISEAVH
jgi:hypothetical protein